MKRYVLVLLAVVLFIFAAALSVFGNEIIWDDIGRGNINLRTVLVNPDNQRIIYFGSDKGVFKTNDGALSWKNVLSIRGQNRSVNFLTYDSQNKNSLYAAGGNGLFYSWNQGDNWKRVFRGKNSLENECTVLAVLPYAIYLGTRSGLFITSDKGRSWHKAAGKIGNSHILAIAYSLKEPDCIYVATRDGVFKTKDRSQSWERIFVVSPSEDGNDSKEESEDQNEEERFSDIRYLIIDPINTDYLYLSTAKGVYKSQDKGKSWELLSNYGLLSKDVNFLLLSHASRLYAVVQSSVFEYKDERWQELSFGLTGDRVNFLASDNQGNIYAACDKGLFRANINYFAGDMQTGLIAFYAQGEPEINAVQQAAIKYAEVEPDKIKGWRKKAQMKAALPKLTVGIDNSSNSNYELYTSATTHYVFEGPQDKSSGWDITLSWDLGDLIWNEAQTSIDVRSRLMVQLRDDILDEVTKLYFERLRLKIELGSLSIEERKKRAEKELRLQELTASIDALTGGYFSQHLQPKTRS